MKELQGLSTWAGAIFRAKAIFISDEHTLQIRWITFGLPKIEKPHSGQKGKIAEPQDRHFFGGAMLMPFTMSWRATAKLHALEEQITKGGINPLQGGVSTPA